jgi:tetratricopeptide (TPR) repeat protein
MRTALAWSLRGGDPELGLRLAATLCEFWYGEGHAAEGMRWMERALESADDAPPAIRMEALNKAGLLAAIRGDHKQGKLWNSAALALSRELGDRANRAWALVYLGAHSWGYPDEYREGIALCEEGLALFRELDEKTGKARALTALGELARLVGDYERARTVYEESLTTARETDNKRREAIAIANLSAVAQHQGDYERAEALLKEAIARLWELEIRYPTAALLATLAGPVAAKGDPKRAACLLGASEALLEAMGVSLAPVDQIEVDRYASAVREQLGEMMFQTAWAEGRAMSLEEAIALALGQDVKAE